MNYKNKVTGIIASIVIFLAIVFFAQAQVEASPDLLNQVMVSMDKSAYLVGEPIAITLRNNLTQSVFSHAVSATPGMTIDYIEQKSTNGEWIRREVRCGYPECYLDIDAPGEITHQKAVTFSWRPTIHFAGKNPDLNAPEGVYRLVVGYQIRKGEDSKQWKSIVITSSEFVVK